MKLDDFVGGTWLVCEYWHYSFKCEEIWVLEATCDHHHFETTCGVFKIDNALEILYGRIAKYHEELD